MKIAALLLALALVLAPAWASAECAWMLWEQTGWGVTPNPDGTWRFLVARDTRVDCESVLQSVWQTAREVSTPGPTKPGIKSMQSAYGIISIEHHSTDTPRYSYRSFKCLPDTIDPRGPKGG